jgi:hypothetical protein
VTANLMFMLTSTGIFATKSTIQYAVKMCTNAVVAQINVHAHGPTLHENGVNIEVESNTVEVDFEAALILCIYQLVVYLRLSGRSTRNI